MTICFSTKKNKCEPLTIDPQSLREVITLYLILLLNMNSVTEYH